MNKEEILNKAVKENNGKDYADLEAAYKGSYVGMIVVAVITTVLTIVDSIVTKSFNFSYYLIWASMETSIFAYKFFKLHKKHEFVFFIVYLLLFFSFLVLYILRLNGVLV